MQNQSSFVELYPLKTFVNVKLGDGHTMDASAIGVVSLRVKFVQVIPRYKLHDVLYFPNFSYNILSVSKAAEKGISVKFSESNCMLWNVNCRAIAVAPRISDLYEFFTTQFEVHSTTHNSKEHIWHHRICPRICLFSL